MWSLVRRLRQRVGRPGNDTRDRAPILEASLGSSGWKKPVQSFCQRTAKSVADRNANKTSLGLLMKRRIGKPATSWMRPLMKMQVTSNVGGGWSIPPARPSSRSAP